MLLRASTIKKGECLKSWICSGITAGLPVEVVDQFMEKESANGTVGSLTLEESSNMYDVI